MARVEYQQRLEDLREDVLYMSEVVGERLRKGFDALEQKDNRLAEEVIEGDGEINRMYLDLEQDCIDLLALQQPVAGDLRFIAASFKIITDLERIADLATNLGQYAIAAENDVFPDVDIQRIGEETIEMLEQSMAAYRSEDVDLCYDVASNDDEVDAMCEAASELVVRDLLESDPLDKDTDIDTESLMREVSRLLLTIRDVERIGDHAVNIAARTLYMIDNNDELLY
ncbi:phosphate transport system protein [Halogranum amylolyticum]|uniref:Phosphate-specific transport system accessory protein PhoU n=1 Tax=Halogranum amylolyticum TaxID=660520 RepID=A0A1H8NEN1_9EURY|nr:phosphate signaling complex protein PhoU [Halogranum amylolyticum]SEO27918.1 phosphate transport system protein [Halogranum amylolyticum]